MGSSLCYFPPQHLIALGTAFIYGVRYPVRASAQGFDPDHPRHISCRQDFRHVRRQSQAGRPFGAQIATTIGLMKAGEETAPTPSNYGYTLRRAKGAPWVAHSSRNISLRSIFPLRPDTAPFWWIEGAPRRDVLDQIRPSAGLRISFYVMRQTGSTIIQMLHSLRGKL